MRIDDARKLDHATLEARAARAGRRKPRSGRANDWRGAPDRRDGFPEVRMRQTHDRAFEHSGKRVDPSFHFLRTDVETAGNDQIWRRNGAKSRSRKCTMPIA